MRFQQTVQRPFHFSGTALHSGQEIEVTVRPAPPRTGLLFHRVDLGPQAVIPACVGSVVATNCATTLGGGGATVSTVEHLLAALWSLGVDNAVIEVDGGEIPALDGSALPFVTMIEESGLAQQDAPCHPLRVTRTVKLVEEGRFVILLPSEKFKVSYTIEFDHPVLQKQYHSLTLDAVGFAREISPARTFGFLKDEELLRTQNLAMGVTLHNTIVIGEDGVLNESLRFDDEFVRHKILDLVGDFSLIGRPVCAHVVAMKAGHGLNVAAVRSLLESTSAWALGEREEAELPARLSTHASAMKPDRSSFAPFLPA